MPFNREEAEKFFKTALQQDKALKLLHDALEIPSKKIVDALVNKAEKEAAADSSNSILSTEKLCENVHADVADQITKAMQSSVRGQKKGQALTHYLISTLGIELIDKNLTQIINLVESSDTSTKFTETFSASSAKNKKRSHAPLGNFFTSTSSFDSNIDPTTSFNSNSSSPSRSSSESPPRFNIGDLGLSSSTTSPTSTLNKLTENLNAIYKNQTNDMLEEAGKNLSKAKKKQLKNQVKTLRVNNQEFLKKIQSTQQELQSKDVELQQLKDSLANSSQASSGLIEDKHRLEGEIAELKSQQRSSRDTIQRLKKQEEMDERQSLKEVKKIRKQHETIKEKDKELKKHENEIEQKSKVINELSNEIAQVKSQAVNQVTELNRQHEKEQLEMKGIISDVENKSRIVSEQLIKEQQKVNGLTIELEENEKNIISNKQQVKQLGKQVKNLESSIKDTQKEAEKLKAELTESKNETVRYKENKKNAQKELGEAKQKLEAQKITHKLALSDQARTHENEIISVQNKVMALEERATNAKDKVNRLRQEMTIKDLRLSDAEQQRDLAQRAEREATEKLAEARRAQEVLRQQLEAQKNQASERERLRLELEREKNLAQQDRVEFEQQDVDNDQKNEKSPLINDNPHIGEAVQSNSNKSKEQEEQQRLQEQQPQVHQPQVQPQEQPQPDEQSKEQPGEQPHEPQPQLETQTESAKISTQQPQTVETQVLPQARNGLLDLPEINHDVEQKELFQELITQVKGHTNLIQLLQENKSTVAPSYYQYQQDKLRKNENLDLPEKLKTAFTVEELREHLKPLKLDKTDEVTLKAIADENRSIINAPFLEATNNFISEIPLGHDALKQLLLENAEIVGERLIWLEQRDNKFLIEPTEDNILQVGLEKIGLTNETQIDGEALIKSELFAEVLRENQIIEFIPDISKLKIAMEEALKNGDIAKANDWLGQAELIQLNKYTSSLKENSIQIDPKTEDLAKKVVSAMQAEFDFRKALQTRSPDVQKAVDTEFDKLRYKPESKRQLIKNLVDGKFFDAVTNSTMKDIMLNTGLGIVVNEVDGKKDIDKAVLRRILKSNREAAYTELEKSNPITEQEKVREGIFEKLSKDLKEKLSFLKDTIVHPEEALITIENFVKHANLALDRALHAKNIDEARVKDIDDKIHALKSLIILLRANSEIFPTGETKLRAIEKLIEDALAQAESLLNGTHNAALVDLMFRDDRTGENAQIHTFVSTEHKDEDRNEKLKEANAKFDEICRSSSSVDGFNSRGEVSAGNNAPTGNYYDQKMVVNVLEIKLTTGESGDPVHKAASLFTRDDTKPYVQGKLRLSDDAFNAIESEFRYRALLQGLSGSVPGILATKWARMNFEMLRSSLPSGDRSVINITKGSLPEACVQAFVLLCRHHGYAYNTVDFNFYPTHDQDVLFDMQWKDKFGADMRKDQFNRLAEGKTADEKSLKLDAENERQETKGPRPQSSSRT